MTERFTQQFKDTLSDYIKHLLKMYELEGWVIILMGDPPDSKDAAAQIETTYGRRVATLKLALDWTTYTSDQQRHYITHEMCHIFSDGIDTVICNGLEKLLGAPAWHMFNEAYHAQMEHMTDHLACVLGWYAEGGEDHDRLWKAFMASQQWSPPTREETT